MQTMPKENIMRRLFLALFTMLATTGLWAAEVAGVKLDDKITAGGKELMLNGAGIRSRAIFKVYVASLYLPAKASDLAGVVAAGSRRVQMNLLRTLSAEQLVDALNDGLKENNPEADLAAVKPQVDELASIMKAFREVKERDVVALDYVDGGTRISLNGETKGTIGGEPFNRALMKIWLGEHPVQADLKKAMLGG